MSQSSVPALFIKRVGETASNMSLMLTAVRRRFVVRFTGGCGYMSQEDAQGLYHLFVRAFDGYEGAILFGGTRMRRRDDPTIIVPGITEIPPLIRHANPGVVLLGVVPKTTDLRLDVNQGMIVEDKEENEYFTIINPDLTAALIIQQSVDEGVDWGAELKECEQIIANLLRFASPLDDPWRQLLVSYNGGKYTWMEIENWVDLKWPVLLVRGSGRKTDEFIEKFADDVGFQKAHPNVLVATKDTASIRRMLVKAGALKGDHLGGAHEQRITLQGDGAGRQGTSCRHERD